VCTSAIYTKRSDKLAGTFWPDTVGQTGSNILTYCYKWQAFCKNTYNSKFSKHLSKFKHLIDTTDSTMEVQYTMGIRSHLNTIQKFYIYIYKEKKNNNNQLNDQCTREQMPSSESYTNYVHLSTDTNPYLTHSVLH